MNEIELGHTYLRRLAEAAEVLPADRREALIREIREHIESGVDDGEPVEEIVRSLGDPNEVVAEAGGFTGEQVELSSLDMSVILALAVTFVLSVLPWIFAVIQGARSQSWSLRQKVIGLGVWPVGTAALQFFALGGEFRTENATGPLTWYFWATAGMGMWMWIGAVYLYRVHPSRVARARRREATGSRLHQPLNRISRRAGI